MHKDYNGVICCYKITGREQFLASFSKSTLTKLNILRVATHMFLERGYTATSIKDICDELCHKQRHPYLLLSFQRAASGRIGGDLLRLSVEDDERRNHRLRRGWCVVP